MNAPANPAGFDFRNGGAPLRLVCEGPWKGWVVYRHPDGQWVSLNKATREDFHLAFEALVKSRDVPIYPNFCIYRPADHAG